MSLYRRVYATLGMKLQSSLLLYCIVLKHLYRAFSGMNRSEALPVCKAQ